MKRSLQIILTLLFIFGLVFLVGYLYIHKIANRSVKEIQELVYAKTNGAYQLSLTDFDLSMNGLKVENAHLYPVPSYFDTTTTLSHSIDLQLEHLNITIENLLSQSEQSPIVKNLFVNNAQLTIKTILSNSKYQLLPNELQQGNPLKSIKFENFNLNRVSLAYLNNDTTIQFYNTSITSNNVLLTPQKIRINEATTKLTIDSIKYTQPPYAIYLKKTQYNPIKKVVSIASIQQGNLISTEEFFDQYPIQKSYTTTSIDSLKIEGTTLSDLLDKKIRANHIHIYNVQLCLTKNKDLPQNHSPKQLLQAHVFNSKFPISIQRITTEGEIKLKTIQNGATKELTLTNFKADISNVSTNHHQPMKCTIASQLNSKGSINVKYEFLNEKGLPFTTNGTIKNFPLTELNTFVPLQSPLQFKSGTIQSLQFKLKSNNHNSNGTVYIKTQGLKLSATNSSSTQSGKIINRLLVLGGNAYHQVKSKGEKNVLKGNVSYKRIPSKSIFHYSLHSVLDGVSNAYQLKKRHK